MIADKKTWLVVICATIVIYVLGYVIFGKLIAFTVVGFWLGANLQSYLEYKKIFKKWNQL